MKPAARVIPALPANISTDHSPSVNFLDSSRPPCITHLSECKRAAATEPENKRGRRA